VGESSQAHLSLRAKRSNLSHLKRELSTAKKVVILGIGNELYDKDSLGLLAAKEIEKSHLSGRYQVFLAGTAPENFTGKIRELSPSHVIFIDAADMGKEPGTIEIIGKDRIASVTLSTHNLPFSLLAEYLTKETGCKVIIIGIQPGENSSNREAIKKLAKLLYQD
jgi:hydrogenase 3 maturation protease